MHIARILPLLAILAPAPAVIAQDAKPAAPTTAPAQPAAPAAAQQPARRFGLEHPKPRTANAVRIATYNIENLFDDKDDPSLSGQYEDKEMTKSDADCRAAAAAIKAIDADVLALQEIESRDALVWFRDTYLVGLGYEHVVSLDAGDERGIEQAVLSRFPIGETKQWVKLDLGGVHPAKWGRNENFNAGKPIVYHRSPLLVTIEVPGATSHAGSGGVARAGGAAPYTLTLVVVHHKAGREGEYWREKEAAKTVELLGAIQRDDPDRNIIWLGDFNAVTNDPSIQRVTAAGWSEAFNPDPAAGNRPPPERVSHVSGRTYDHIFLNPAARRELVSDSTFILGTPIRGHEGYASDHYPMVIDLATVNRP